MSQTPIWKRGINYLNNRRIRYSPRNLRIHAAAQYAYWLRKQKEKQFTILNETQFKATRSSDRIFIFGSGTSLHDITASEWEHMAEHNTLGFTLFTYQQWIRVDYHMTRELQIGQELNKPHWTLWYKKFSDNFDTNPFFKDTIFMAQDGATALVSNRLIGMNFIQPRRILPFIISKRLDKKGIYPEPTRRLSEGIVHASGTLTDCINLAVIGGWKHIVLVGVDLYGKRYFYDTDHHVKPEKTDETHGTVRIGIIENMAQWQTALKPYGQQLWIYNPLSLLTQSLPIYDPDKIDKLTSSSKLY